ncbi:MAG: RecX family transcriptional regulator [Oscillospiraceae bacterium]|nr:RecX family transcriptional regulator [Oscillospiraceae bacterium]
MTRIDSLASKPDRAGRFLVKLSDGQALRLYRQTVEDLGLYPGLELTDSQMEQLLEHAGQTSAKMRAVRIVSAASVSKDDLQRRLVQKGESPQQAKEAVAWLSELQLLDDAQVARQTVQSCIAKGYGIARAKQALYEKRIPKAHWEAALAGYPDQREKVLAFLKSKITSREDPREVKRAVDALIRRGHSYSLVRSCLEQLELSNSFREE